MAVVVKPGPSRRRSSRRCGGGQADRRGAADRDARTMDKRVARSLEAVARPDVAHGVRRGRPPCWRRSASTACSRSASRNARAIGIRKALGAERRHSVAGDQRRTAHGGIGVANLIGAAAAFGLTRFMQTNAVRGVAARSRDLSGGVSRPRCCCSPLRPRRVTCLRAAPRGSLKLSPYASHSGIVVLVEAASTPRGTMDTKGRSLGVPSVLCVESASRNGPVAAQKYDSGEERLDADAIHGGPGKHLTGRAGAATRGRRRKSSIGGVPGRRQTGEL